MTYWRHILVALSTLFIVTTGAAHAAPATPQSPTCKPGAVLQQDMMGTYESQYMLVTVYSCSIVSVRWINDYGEHSAGYITEERLPSGGLGMSGFIPDTEIKAYLDGVPYAALTPMEPGFVRFTTINAEWKYVRSYRLEKTS